MSMAFYFIPREKIQQRHGPSSIWRGTRGKLRYRKRGDRCWRGRSQFHQNMLVSHMTSLDAPYQGMAEWRRQLLFGAGSSPLMLLPRHRAWPMGFCSGHAAMLAFVDTFWLIGAHVFYR